MSLMEHKGKVQQVVEGAALGGVLKEAARSTLRSALDGPAQEAVGNGAQSAGGSVLGKASKAGKPGLVVAGGVAGLTAASAAVSAVRRRQESGS